MVGFSRRYFVNFDGNHPMFDERVLLNAREQRVLRDGLGQYDASSIRLKSPNKQEHAIVHALLNPALMCSHELLRLSSIWPKLEENDVHSRALLFGLAR